MTAIEPSEPQDPKISFGQKLRFFRLEKGLSQEQLGLLAGIDRTYISDCEAGRRNTSLDLIHRFAQALQIEPWELLK